MNITKNGVLFCRDMVAEYLEQAKTYEDKAETCSPHQRGAYRSHATQSRKNAQRMQANYDAQMGWLVEHNYPLYLELKEIENKAETVVKKAFHFGEEAAENDFSISEYFKDFCILLGVNRWHEIDPALKNEIRKQFKKGEAANKKVRGEK